MYVNVADKYTFMYTTCVIYFNVYPFYIYHTCKSLHIHPSIHPYTYIYTHTKLILEPEVKDITGQRVRTPDGQGEIIEKDVSGV